MSRSEWQAYQRREQRKARFSRLFGCVLMCLSAVVVAVAMWAILVVFLLIAGGTSAPA